jgi:hypothetical protein
MAPEIEYFTVFCITDNDKGEVHIIEKARIKPKAKARGKKIKRLQAAE